MSFFISITLISCCFLALTALTPGPGRVGKTEDINPIQTFGLIMAAIAIRLAMQSVLNRNGMIMCTMDEPIRWGLASVWSRDAFYFTHWDGIWLTGNFVFFGSLLRWVPTPMLGLQMGVLGCQLLTIFSGFYLTWVMSGRKWLGVMAALLIAGGYPFLWMGRGPLAETLIGGCFMMGMALSRRFIRDLGKIPFDDLSGYLAHLSFFLRQPRFITSAGWL